MWTCGMDIATQHETPATHSSACTVTGLMPMGRSEAGRRATRDATAASGTAACAAWIGGRRRNTSASGRIDSTQNTPMPT